MAPDKFKGSLSAAQAAAALALGVRRAVPRIVVRVAPMADGGEGTVDAFLEAGWERIAARVLGPLGEPVEAAFAREGPRAVIEAAAASGLELVREHERRPLLASSAGTGELLRAALDRGARDLVVGLGGSATTDGGSGLLAALGARFLDRNGAQLPPGGGALRELAQIDLDALDSRLREVRIRAAVDVDLPLLGPRGAARQFAPQKGAGAAEVEQLEDALAHFAEVAARTLGRDLRELPGAGAAGGLGFGLAAFLGADLAPGALLVADLRDLESELAGADWCFTGEGKIDAQTLAGKTVAGVAQLARRAGVRTVAFAGSIEPEAEAALAALGVVAIPILDRPYEEALAQQSAFGLLARAAERTARLLCADGPALVSP
ncbi:MAG: glycerate kinase [Vulcanimicrobiaceae bacterium]